MKFVIDNRTRYQTRHLRALVTRAYKIAAELAGPARVAAYERNWSKIRIRFARSNRRDNGASTGHAQYNSNRPHVGVHDEADRVDLALTIAHEIGHCFGLRHPDMRGGPLDAYHWRTEDDCKEMRVRVFGWADSLPLDPKPTRAKPTTDEKRQRDLLRTRISIARWQSKAKRAATALKKFKAKERRLVRLTGDTP